ncbi:aminoacyl tRNA synthase complex-interacting multifunctional protein 1 isoform X1 [Lampetra fluviatilis]
MFVLRPFVKMSQQSAVIGRLEQRAAEADQIIAYLKQQVALLKDRAVLQQSQNEEERLQRENETLKQEIEVVKQQLIAAEVRNGLVQIPLPTQQTACVTPPSKSGTETAAEKTSQSLSSPSDVDSPQAAAQPPPTGDKKKEKAEKKGEKKDKEKKVGGAEEAARPVDVSRLDLRVGRIVSAQKHPDADSLYVEQVDVAEAAARTVVSGLVKHIPLEQMQDRMIVVMCNLKPAKMRGVLSQAMVMCASSPDKVEILDPPAGAVPGDRITFKGYPGEPDKELNPKKKIWEQVQPDLLTNAEFVATYKGVPFEVAGKGVCKAQTMANSGIK